MENEKPIPIGIIRRSDNYHLDYSRMPDPEVSYIKIYSISIKRKFEKKGIKKIKKRNYLVEMFHFQGFGLVKFYPKIKKNDGNKYKLRGAEIGYSLTVPEIRNILRYCSVIMKSYLDEFPHNFVGYIGQTDDKDNFPNKMRDEAQRASIYDRYVTSIFLPPKYSVSSNKVLGELNMKLIRKSIKHKELTLTPQQKINYKHFTEFLVNRQNDIPDLMTEKTKRKYYPQLFKNK